MIPLGLKVVYTIFVCALVPIYWREYGSANFLWFSDIALLALVPALWLENAALPTAADLNRMAQKYFKQQGSGSQQTWDQGFENGYTDGFNKAHLRK